MRLWMFLFLCFVTLATSLPTSTISQKTETTEFPSKGFIHDWDTRTHERTWYWKADEYPSPVTQPARFCGRYAVSYICDPDSIITVDEADRLDELINNLRKRAPCMCQRCPQAPYGAAVGVALMKYMAHPANKSKLATMAEFGKRLHQSWNISSCQDHIIIVIVTTEPRGFYTAIGPDLTDVVTRDMADGIIVNNKQYFNEGNYSAGLESIVEDYSTLLSRIMLSRQEKQHDISKSSVGLIVGIIIGVVVLGLVVFAAITIYRGRKDRFRVKDDVFKITGSHFKEPATCERPFFLGTPSNGVYQPCSSQKTAEDDDMQGASSGVDSDTPLDSYEPVFTDDEKSPDPVIFEKVAIKSKDQPQSADNAAESRSKGSRSSLAAEGAQKKDSEQTQEATSSKNSSGESPSLQTKIITNL